MVIRQWVIGVLVGWLLIIGQVTFASNFSVKQFLEKSPQIRYPLRAECPLIYSKIMDAIHRNKPHYDIEWVSFRISSSTVHRFSHLKTGVCHCEHNPKYHKGFQCTFTKH